MTEQELRAAVDEVMDAQALRLARDRTEWALAQVDVLIERSEAIAALRAEKGKTLSVTNRRTLADLSEQLEELGDVWSGR